MKNLKNLDRINWDFNDALTNFGVHSFHWYLGTYIPQIPSILISNFTDRGENILDPFCGGGTTLVESMKLRRRSIGVDSNILACLISKVKTTMIDYPILEKEIQKIITNIDNDALILNSDDAFFTKNEKTTRLRSKISEHIPDFPDKEGWFHPKTLLEIGLIKLHIDDLANKYFKDFCIIALSDRLKYLSIHKTRNYGYIADNCVNNENYKKEHNDAIIAFKRKLIFMGEEMRKFMENNLNSDENISSLNDICKVYSGDCRNLNFIEDNSIDFVVTSPPYPTTIDYTTGHRLSFYWLGYNIESINSMKKNEIGPRYQRHLKEKGLLAYCHDMEQSLGEIHRVMKDGSYFSLVFGEMGKRIDGVTVEDEIQRICKENIGFKLNKTIPRSITKQRLGAKSIQRECIYIFKK